MRIFICIYIKHGSPIRLDNYLNHEFIISSHFLTHKSLIKQPRAQIIDKSDNNFNHEFITPSQLHITLKSIKFTKETFSLFKIYIDRQ